MLQKWEHLQAVMDSKWNGVICTKFEMELTKCPGWAGWKHLMCYNVAVFGNDHAAAIGGLYAYDIHDHSCLSAEAEHEAVPCVEHLSFAFL